MEYAEASAWILHGVPIRMESRTMLIARHTMDPWSLSSSGCSLFLSRFRAGEIEPLNNLTTGDSISLLQSSKQRCSRFSLLSSISRPFQFGRSKVEDGGKDRFV